MVFLHFMCGNPCYFLDVQKLTLVGRLTEVGGSVCKYASEDSIHPFSVLIVAKSTG